MSQIAQSSRLPLAWILLVSLVLSGPGLAESETRTEMRVVHGDMPVLIVAGHGGKQPLEGASPREKEKVNDPHFVLFGDAHTNEMAELLAGALAQEAGDGHKPSLVLNLVHRRYADVNRSPELTSHDPVGVAHHAVFHQAIDDELARLVQAHGWALLLDIHGQARYETTLLLGTGENSVVDAWSLDALWGSDGVVPSLTEAGFTVEPGTPEGQQRYGGGYTIRHHGLDKRVEAWQMEHSRAIRDQVDSRSRYVEVMAKAVLRALRHPPSRG